MGITGAVRTAIVLLAGLAWCALAGSASGEKRSVHSVLDYGARGDGRTNDAKAFGLAWAAACGSRGPSASVLVPAGRVFLVGGGTRFNGPCASTRITVQVVGTITAPPENEWSGLGKTNYWMLFYGVDGLRVTGNGMLDGKGQSWWAKKCRSDQGCVKSAPTALMLMKCNKLELSHFSSKDSPQMHIVIGMSRDVKVTRLTITAPAHSPNTDGIHIGECQGVHISDSTIGTGDDCVSIGSGSRFVTVDRIICGPGHGVSVGSLGKRGAKASVENIDVSHVQFINTQNGARIKTWEGGEGYAKSISFSDIKFTNVEHPVVINQFYRDRATPVQGAVAIRNVTYTNLIGTSSRPTAVEFDCSKSGSCTGIHVKSMAITGSDGRETVARCRNVRGDTSGSVHPKIPCLA